MPITMQDIARELNLSQATVSKALTGRNCHDIQAETQERVRAAARRMGYRPNHLARALSSRRSYLINLMVRNVHPAFYSRSVAAFEAALCESEYDLRIRETEGWTAERWREAAVDRWPVDGVIVLESRYDLPNLFENAAGNLPVVNIGSMCYPEVDHIQIDLHTGATDAVRHLLDLGRTRIGFLSTDPVGSVDTRVLAYEEEMRRVGTASRRIVMKRHESIGSVSQRALARDTMAEYLQADGDIDALFCFNDEYAIGALRALKDRGLRVPEDVALVGCDDIEDTEYQDPTISTLRYPYEEAARFAWEMLQRRIEEPDLPRQSVVLPSKLIVRQSSLPAAAEGG